MPAAEDRFVFDSDDGETASEAASILLVDDERNVLESLKRAFAGESYKIASASSAGEAVKILEAEPVEVVVTDYAMPGHTGSDLLKVVKDRWPDTIRIMLTGHADVQSIMGAVNEGAVFKFITKPWNNEDLKLTIRLALRQHALLRENMLLKEMAKEQQLKIKNYSVMLDENRTILGYVLDRAGVVSKDDYREAMDQRIDGEVALETLVRLGLAGEMEIIEALRSYLDLEYVDLLEMKLNEAAVKFLPRDICERGRMIPIDLDAHQMTLAMADPSDMYKCDNLSLMTGLKIKVVIARASDILRQLAAVYDENVRSDPSDPDFISDIDPLDEVDIIIEEEDEGVNIQQMTTALEIPPIIRIVNAIISEAIRLKASDIHIEPKNAHTIIRFRIDGMLCGKIKIPPELHSATVSRIKILSRIDIAERRKPQDGRVTVKAGGRTVDIRVSCMPTIIGEKVVMRILDKTAAIRRLDELGVLEADLSKINNLKQKPQGMIIATGPTGSGKTTMLYSILNEMLERSKSFQTIEDPVEYFLQDASQVLVRDKIGLSFASVLRATLRQDPDVILVGEIRDLPTADVAFKAALTGHMVLSTLHTNNSVASITRMIDLGIKPYLIASALEGIIAQRLVRKICGHCKEACRPNAETMELLRIPKGYFGGRVYHGRGCDRCNQTGYSGRTGIFEIFLINEDYRHFICESYRESELYDMARANGMMSLAEAGAEKVRLGETTLSELLRVLGPQVGHERACAGCGKTIDARFLYCPYCGEFKQNSCIHCKMPLEPDWSNCPFCGRAR